MMNETAQQKQQSTKMDEISTQLSDTRPILDHPLRVAIPVNVPSRNATANRDQAIYISTFSPMAIAQSNHHFYNSKETTSNKLFAQSLIVEDKSLYMKKAKIVIDENGKNQLIRMEHNASNKNQLKDFQVLAASSRRADKKDVEATAYASLGVVYDNQEEYLISIEYYNQYLSLCQELNDAVGISSAYNCIGINYMLLVNPNLEKSTIFADKIIQNSVKNLDECKNYINYAIQAHSNHLSNSPDLGGQFVANINLGICYIWLSDVSLAAKAIQDALKIAIKMQTLYGQSIAVGNLGLVALYKKDYATTKTCFDQHLQLIQALIDPEAEIVAWKLVCCTSIFCFVDYFILNKFDF